MNIKTRIDELRKVLNFHNEKYYNQDDPVITDYEYDKLSLKLRQLEESYPEYKLQNSPTQKVGGTPKKELKKVLHDVPIISLQDVFSKEEVYKFIEKSISELKSPQFIVEKKIDGLTIVLRYYNGELKEALTRGDGTTGESVLENILKINSIPRTIPCKLEYLEIRGEIYMTYENFTKTNQKQEELGRKTFKNPRNLAAGTIRQLDSNIMKERNIDIFIFNLEISKGKTFHSHSDTLNWLTTQGFTVSPNFKICTTAEEVWTAISEIEKQRWNLKYPIDGAVVKINNLNDRLKLGTTSKVPKWAVAFKYPPEQKETIIKDIIVQVGRTGKLTPIAILEPVTLANTTVAKATLHNQDFINTKDIHIGDSVLIQKAGDIIPEIISTIPHKRIDNTLKYTLPNICPVCKSRTGKEFNGVDIYCTNPNCEAQSFRRISYFTSKDAMNIIGFGQTTSEILIKEEYIKKISDIYNLKTFKKELIDKGILGKEKSVTNLINAIEISKNNDIDKLITGLGIKNIGKQSARTLSSNFESMDALAEASYEQLIKLEDFGETIVHDVLDFFNSNTYRELIKELKKAGVNTVSKNYHKKKDTRFAGKTFVITGTLPNLKRDDVSQIIHSLGGKTSGSVSKKTTYLIAGNEAGSKLVKAEQLGITILTEDDFKDMVN